MRIPLCEIQLLRGLEKIPKYSLNAKIRTTLNPEVPNEQADQNKRVRR